jgi:hypothetical protein
MDRDDNLAGVGSLNGISTSRQNPTTLAGPPISMISTNSSMPYLVPSDPQELGRRERQSLQPAFEHVKSIRLSLFSIFPEKTWSGRIVRWFLRPRPHRLGQRTMPRLASPEYVSAHSRHELSPVHRGRSPMQGSRLLARVHHHLFFSAYVKIEPFTIIV